MDDGHRPARSPRSQLLAEEGPILLHRDGRVVEAAGIDGDLVPMADVAGPIEPVSGTLF